MRCIRYFTAFAIFLMAHGQAHAQDVRFASPSGNIICNLNEYAAECALSQLSPSFTQRPADCSGDWGRYFYVVAGQTGQLGCVTDVIDDAAIVLDYGQTLRAGEISCVSRTTGITCLNSIGGGFSVRRSEQEVF